MNEFAVWLFRKYVAFWNELMLYDLEERPMTTPKLIGITGKIGSGKDTVGDAIVQRYFDDRHKTSLGRNWERLYGMKMSFAAPLKKAVAAMLGVPVEKFEDRVWKETVIGDIGKSPRELLLSLGTEWGRNMIHPDFWVMLSAQEYNRGDTHLIFCDVRFDNEAKWIRQQGGTVIRLVREGDQIAPLSAINHPSEAGISEELISATVYAEAGDVHQLRARALRTLEEFQCFQLS